MELFGAAFSSLARQSAMSQNRQFIPLSQARPPFFAGLDLGGTDIKVGIVDNLGQPLCWLTTPTEATKGPEDTSQRMGQSVLDAIARAGLEAAAVVRVGLGSPGAIDAASGKLMAPANLPGWDGFPLRDRVAACCGLPVTFVNDANAAAYGEFWVGAGREFHSLVLFTLGTGIGCGIIVGDLAISGEHNFGAECGHIVINCDEDAPLCGCGHRGHLEAYAGAKAVVRRANEALASGRASSLSKFQKCHELTPKLLAHQAEAGDALALEIAAETARYVAVGIVNLMHTIDPGCVLLGGAMTFGGPNTDLGLRFLDWVKQEVGRRTFRTLAERTVIDFASLGSDAGYIGAAGMARAEHHRLTH
jgi:glucokinase